MNTTETDGLTDERLLGEMIDWVQSMGEYGSEPDDERMAARVISRLRAWGWRPIDSAPRDGTRVILGWPGGGVRYGFYLDNSCTKVPWQGWRGPSMELPFPNEPPTCWQPMPEFPPHSPDTSEEG